MWRELREGTLPGEASIHHVVITRFATRMVVDAAPKREWVQSRFDLFERYCLSSMQAQDRRDFSWLLLVDSAVDDDLTSRIRRYESVFAPIRVATVGPGHEQATVAQHVLAGVNASHSAILTTRLDNDDAVSTDYMNRLRAAAAGVSLGERRVIVFTHGYELAHGRLYWRVFPRSPFASFLEPARPPNPPTTILGAEHEQVDALAPAITLGAPAAWIQVVHGGNLVNRVRGLRVPRRSLAARFAIEDDHVNEQESIAPLLFGMLGSALRLAWQLITTPRYWAKVGQVVGVRRGGSSTGSD